MQGNEQMVPRMDANGQRDGTLRMPARPWKVAWINRAFPCIPVHQRALRARPAFGSAGKSYSGVCALFAESAFSVDRRFLYRNVPFRRVWEQASPKEEVDNHGFH